jgi:hypothetical protein
LRCFSGVIALYHEAVAVVLAEWQVMATFASAEPAVTFDCQFLWDEFMEVQVGHQRCCCCCYQIVVCRCLYYMRVCVCMCVYMCVFVCVCVCVCACCVCVRGRVGYDPCPKRHQQQSACARVCK